MLAMLLAVQLAARILCLLDFFQIFSIAAPQLEPKYARLAALLLAVLYTERSFSSHFQNAALQLNRFCNDLYLYHHLLRME